ncbi:MAG: hypothetical protein ACRDZ1_04695 [Acidimicrobiia bacterium]
MASPRARSSGAALLALIVLAAACSSTDSIDGRGENGASEVVAEFGSYDRATDRPQRVLVGLLASDEGQVAYGTVTFRFVYRGTRKDPVENGRPGPPIEASYRPLPNVGNPRQQSRPTVVAATETRGVYGAEGIRFDRPGFWSVLVTGAVDGESFETESSFEVNAQPQVPAEDEPAPRTDNTTLATADVPPHAIDSRAHNGPIPDPELHQTSVAAALAASRPVMVVVSTPLFCQSRFCGPITDEIQELAAEYGDRVAFVHLEVWQDHEEQIVNRAAAQWAVPRGGADRDLREPWIFTVAPDGTIVERFDNLATTEELRAATERLIAVVPGGAGRPRDGLLLQSVVV